MGIFHYKVSLVPRAYFGGEIPASLSETETQRGEWWVAHPPSAGLLTALRALLPEDKSWGDIEEYASIGDFGSDIRIWKDAGRVEGIEFRFSPVADEWALMQRFVDIARVEQCLLLEGGSGALFEANEELVRQRLASSHAVDFIRDPAATIVRAAGELEDDG
jgi:hypothetical protein